MKRYAIVRVDGICPLYLEQRTYKCEMGNFTCEKCYTYGDTKEQMILKVAQVIFKRKIKAFKKVVGVEISSKKDLKQIYEKCLETSKEIVEFLGVE
jgi:hypothetical protein